MHFDGNLNDESGKIWTAYGGATISAAAAKFGSAGLYLPGTTGSYISTPTTSDWVLGTGPFCIETFLNPISYPSSNGGQIIGSHNYGINSSFIFALTSSGYLNFYSDKTITSITGTIQVPIGQKTHCAVSRDENNNLRLFVGGIVDKTVTMSDNFSSNPRAITIGGDNDGSTCCLNAYMDELRVSKGTARYTANFTPPSVPFNSITTNNNFYFCYIV